MNKWILLAAYFSLPILPALSQQPGHKCLFRPEQNTEEAYAIDPANLSQDISPKDDFFDHVNAKWHANNPIPDNKPGLGAFSVLDEQSLQTLHQIMNDVLDNNSTSSQGSNAQILYNFFKSGMDTLSANQLGVQAILPILNKLSQMNEKAELSSLIADNCLKGLPAPLSIYTYSDQKDATKNIFYLSQAGLGLPDRDYYFREDTKSKNLRAAYKKYIIDLFVLSGETKKTAKKKAGQVFDLEKKLAGNMMTMVQRRDPYATYNKLTAKELQSLMPHVSWDNFYQTLGIAEQAEVIVESPAYMKALDSLIEHISLPQWTAYYKFHAINSNARYLGKTLGNLKFDFYGREIYGVKMHEEWWKYIIRSADDLIGDLLGEEYVKTTFSPQAKAKAKALINHLKEALADRINALDWMGEETKAKALEKLTAIDVKIGYPDKWKSYQGLQILDQPFVLNRMAANEYSVKYDLSKLNKPVDRTEWLMTPQTVNAYYNPSLNEIVFPAAILQAPFFSENADDASNYGGIGMVIGHELTHGFDDAGSQYDAEGNLKNWWTPEDAEKYKAMAQLFVKQYNAYEPLKGVHINGELTLGENIADLGGLIIAYEAFKKASPNDETIDGLDPDHRFFINFAQIWRGQLRDEVLRTYLYTDPHSPERYRVNGTLTNFAPFYQTYEVKPGDKMFTPVENRSSMW